MTERLRTVLGTSHKKLVTYVMAGDPDAASTLHILHDLVASGADIIELGIPFSDPMADGAIIQAAAGRAIAGGMTLCQTLDLVGDFRLTNTKTPLILMGYANPVFSYGFKAFADDAARNGVDGVILVDLPPEESEELERYLMPNGVPLIRLVTPTTTPERMRILLRGATGFVYYVSMTGVTGAGAADSRAIDDHLNTLRPLTPLPFMIGFGIRTPEQVRALAPLADGVVVGSALVDHLYQGHDAKEFVASLAHALTSSP